MNAQQLYDYIIKPTHQYMGGNYESKESNFLSLCTAAIESNCGEYIKQINGPALGIWQMEPDTHDDIWNNCDAFRDSDFLTRIDSLIPVFTFESLIDAPIYACAMARLKYSMDPHPLPKLSGDKDLDCINFFEYYKRVYNTKFGASTYQKWVNALEGNGVWDVKL
ncbi:MAG: hypothetical protein Unbinned6437contig1000_29 [Prokaryotic dsDNA virus sp.]|nr:MAG: hypothetical protein Unbinned6437contig1000_29 [Prokaryotic dsDNA virus sp.]|tara:strand:+ start:24751 stop:25245 length:495 start_codon:yes stop_codon:yes gene_type:complete